MPNELLSIQPGELKFPFELKKQISSSLRLINSSDSYVAFKVGSERCIPGFFFCFDDLGGMQFLNRFLH
jgi:hypothetical protein